MKPYVVKIAGEAGYGIMSAGLMLNKVAMRSGYYTFDYSEYPSIVRGGHNVMQVAIDTKPVKSPYLHTNFLIALDQDTLSKHMGEVVKGGSVLYDSEAGMDLGKHNGLHVFDVPLYKMAKEIGGSLFMKNTAALGAAMAILGADGKHLLDLISDAFSHKHEAVVRLNHEVAKVAWKYVQDHHFESIRPALKPRKRSKKYMAVTGNESVAFGAMAAGLQFAAIYPMTPTSNILHVLAEHQEKLGFIYKQPEDEISAINMAMGAAHAGARSMVATSGGGFCLMSEGYGLAGLAEIPVVIIEGMRGAPATGLPTWTEQGDLQFVLHAHQGDFPRIVLAPGDVTEAFYMTMDAMNLAEKYQCPVVVLIDKHICESHESVLPFDYKKYSIERGNFISSKRLAYKRYAMTASGMSPRSIPGVGNHFVANSDEHDEVGYSNEDSQNRLDQMHKRMHKMEVCEKKDMQKPVLYGPKDAQTTIVSWGSNKGSILEALKHSSKVNYLHVTWMHPFPSDAIKKALAKTKKLIGIECNYSGQFLSLLKEKTGIVPDDVLLKYDGRPIFPEEILQKLRSKS